MNRVVRTEGCRNCGSSDGSCSAAARAFRSGVAEAPGTSKRARPVRSSTLGRGRGMTATEYELTADDALRAVWRARTPLGELLRPKNPDLMVEADRMIAAVAAEGLAAVGFLEISKGLFDRTGDLDALIRCADLALELAAELLKREVGA